VVVPTHLLLIRHGQSTWNAQRRWQGQADPPLTELGEEQAREAARQLGTFDAIYASDLHRAAVTAGIVADELGLGPVVPEPRLREHDVGEWTGMTVDQVKSDWPGYLEEHRRPPGFEPAEHVVARLVSLFHDLSARHPGGEVLCVTHGGVIRVLRRELEAPDEVMPNLGGSWFTAADDGAVHAGHVVRLLVDELTTPRQ
jgi:broad specificity phosphatase PhoE